MAPIVFFSLYYQPFLCHQSSPSVLLLRVEIRLQQWTLRVMLMECIRGASSFLSPACMQNHPNGEPLALVYITTRGANAMVTPVDSLKTFGRRVSTITASKNVFYCWIKKRAEEGIGSKCPGIRWGAVEVCILIPVSCFLT